jgi:hypothetical protein
VVAVASPVPADALALLDREEAKAGADGTLLVAKGQLLERLGRKAEAKAAYDDAVKRAKKTTRNVRLGCLAPSSPLSRTFTSNLADLTINSRAQLICIV